MPKVKCPDGHIADSPEEAVMDAILCILGYKHEIHKRIYPGRYNADFWLPDLNIYVEFVGRLRDPRYKPKHERKKAFYKEHYIPVA